MRAVFAGLFNGMGSPHICRRVGTRGSTRAPDDGTPPDCRAAGIAFLGVDVVARLHRFTPGDGAGLRAAALRFAIAPSRARRARTISAALRFSVDPVEPEMTMKAQ
jgi:hypothetical protein